MRENIILALATASIGLSACAGGNAEKKITPESSRPTHAVYRSYHADTLPTKTADVDKLIPKVDEKIKMAVAYLKSCPSENVRQAAIKFEELNSRSRIAFYNQENMDGLPIGFIIVSDDIAKTTQIAIDPYSILSGSVPTEEIAKDIFQAVINYNAYEQGLSPEKAAKVNADSPITKDESFCTY